MTKREFETGSVRDSDLGKEDYPESISFLALKRYALYMEGKAKRYGKGNWRKGIPPEEYLKSMIRHLQKLVVEWQDGICEEEDDHLSAMMFNLQGMMHEIELIKRGKGRFEISEEYNKIYKIK
jgi:hypothetical protein